MSIGWILSISVISIRIRFSNLVVDVGLKVILGNKRFGNYICGSSVS